MNEVGNIYEEEQTKLKNDSETKEKVMNEIESVAKENGYELVIKLSDEGPFLDLEKV